MSQGRVVLIASGLRDIGGHNYSYTQEVETELKGRGFCVDVLARRLLSEKVREETGYQPVFSKGTYDFPYGSNALYSLVKLWSQAGVYATELAAGLTPLLGSARVIFCHTLSDFELVGWSRFLRQRSLVTPLVLMMRETPGFANMGFYRRWLHPFTGLRGRALRSINRHAPAGFVLATDTVQLAIDYAHIFKGRIETYPIPVPALSVASVSPGRERGITLGYAGDCRAAKGFPRLAPMINDVLSASPEALVRFVVQMYRGTYDSGQKPGGWDELERLATRFPARMKIVTGVLDDTQYQNLFASLDAVLIPNDHPGFRAGSSNVYCEAAASGKPVVVGEGTWMATQVARYGGGITFSLGNPRDFGRAVGDLARDWKPILNRAQGFAKEWRAQHNRARLVDALLGSIASARQ